MEPFQRLESRVVPLPRANVDTDQIIPARYLKVTSKEGLGEGLFANWREDPKFVLNQAEHQGSRILLAGDNFGCGSSREHAPWALLDHGFRAIVSTRFADIFRNNSLKNGLLPVAIPEEAHQALFAAVEADPSVRIVIDLETETLTLPGGKPVGFAVEPFARRCLLDGVDQLGYLLAQDGAISAYEAERARPLNTRA